jgi:hypothetical protein
MPAKEEIAKQITDLATAGYDAAISCFSSIATERIQEFGNIKVLTKLSPVQALSGLLQTIHKMDKAGRDYEVTRDSIAAKKLVAMVFPETHAKAPIQSPGNVLLSLIDLAKEYRNIIITAQKLEYSIQAISDLKITLIDLQQAYDHVAAWSATYPEVVQLKDNNHIATIGGLISAIERETAGAPRLKSGETTVLDIPTRAR